MDSWKGLNPPLKKISLAREEFDGRKERKIEGKHTITYVGRGDYNEKSTIGFPRNREGMVKCVKKCVKKINRRTPVPQRRERNMESRILAKGRGQHTCATSPCRPGMKRREEKQNIGSKRQIFRGW